jgi:chromosome segregation ATPase
MTTELIAARARIESLKSEVEVFRSLTNSALKQIDELSAEVERLKDKNALLSTRNVKLLDMHREITSVVNKHTHPMWETEDAHE